MGPKYAKIGCNRPNASRLQRNRGPREAHVGPKEAKIAQTLAGCSGSVSQGRPDTHFASFPLLDWVHKFFIPQTALADRGSYGVIGV